jgi:alpha-tubulin suppressor-like RCC1 family protein
VGRNLTYTKADLKGYDVFCGEDDTVDADSFWLHVCLVDREGHPWTWGLNNNFQASGQSFLTASLRRFPFKHKVIQTCAGEFHSLALTDSGCVFAWGNGKDGQLGVGEFRGDGFCAKEPLQVDSIQSKVRSISCGARHSLAITEMDELLCWGLNNHGQCGQCSDSCDKVLLPSEVKHLTGMSILKVCAGIAHSVASTKLLGIQSWGWNSSGQLGVGTKESAGIPLLVEVLGMGAQDDDMMSETTVDLSCGSMHTVVLFRSAVRSVVYGWGSNRQQQLVEDDADCPETITSPIILYDGDRKVDQAYCTYWSTILLLDGEK